MSTPTLDPEKLLKPAAAAEFFTLSASTLANWRSSGGGPRFIRLSDRAIRYRLGDLLEFADERRCSSTSSRITPPSLGAR